MKRIGSGVQFIVYDLENGRVLKKPTTFIQKLLGFHKIAPKYHLLFHPIHNIVTAIGAEKMSRLSIEQLQKNLENINLDLVGNPVITAGGAYEQDKVLIFGEQVMSRDPLGRRELFNKYIDHLLSCWDYGFSDTVFNFMINCGVTAKNAVILIDLGELTWDKNEVAELVKKKNWEKRSSYNKLWDIDIKKYVQEEFNEKITLSNLDQRWKSKITNSPI